MFMLPMPPEALGLAAVDGLACGVWLFIGMFIGIVISIFCPGDGEACGVGDEGVAGICIPGMFCISIFCGDAAGARVGEAVGICMPGMFSIPVFPGVGEVVGVGDCAGMFMPRMSMLFMFMPRMPRFFGARRALCFRRAVALAFDPAFRFAFGLAFGLDIFMPGISCMSCP